MTSGIAGFAPVSSRSTSTRSPGCDASSNAAADERTDERAQKRAQERA